MSIKVLFLLLFALTLITTVHEFGHYITSKIFGVYVIEFSIGMGPKLFQWKGKETTYSIRALPLGGYCMMAGDDSDKEIGDIDLTNIPADRFLSNANPLKKVIIFSAGIILNVALSLIIVSMVFLSNGAAYASPEPLINSVTENSPAQRAGILSGDRIVKVELENGYSIKPKTFDDMANLFSIYDGNGEIEFEILRDGKTLNLKVTPEYSQEEERYLIGVTSFEGSVVDINIFNCWKFGFEYLREVTALIVTTLLGLFRGVGYNNLSGVVGMYSTTEEVVSYGASSYFLLIALISINIGLFNALPLPVFDGGKIVILLIETIIGKPLNKRFVQSITMASMMILILLMIFVTYSDIVKLF